MNNTALLETQRIASLEQANNELQLSQLRNRMVANSKLGISVSVEILCILNELGYNSFDKARQEEIDKIPQYCFELQLSSALEYTETVKFKKLDYSTKLEFLNNCFIAVTRSANRLSHIRAILVTKLDIDAVKHMAAVAGLVKLPTPQLT